MAGARHEGGRVNEREINRMELGDDAAWALEVENGQHNLVVWIDWRKLPHGERMAALYGFGEIRP